MNCLPSSANVKSYVPKPTSIFFHILSRLNFCIHFRVMQPKFSADEKVLCFHGPLLYEAKILKHKKESGSYNYFVHYQVKKNINYVKCL